MLTWSRFANSCRGLRPVRSAWQSASCGPAISAGWQRGWRSRSRRRSFLSRSRILSPELAGAGGGGLVHGLKIAAVAVVAVALLSMVRSLAPDRERATIAGIAAALVLFLPFAWTQVAAIVIGGVAGFAFLKSAAVMPGAPLPRAVSRAVAISALALFALLLAGLPILSATRRFSSCRLSMSSIAPARWSSAAVTSCCRSFRRKSCRGAGSTPTPSWRAMAPHRRCQDRFSRSLLSLVRRLRSDRTGGAERLSALWRFFFRRCFWSLGRCRSGIYSAIDRRFAMRCQASMRRWSDCLRLRSTIRFGPARSCGRRTSHSRPQPFFCSLHGGRLRGWS